MATNRPVREEIIAVLMEHYGGEVRDDKGFATKQIFKYCSRAKLHSQISSELGEMDKEGLIHRDMPSKKRCTRIALVEYSSHPPVKNVRTMIEQSSSQMADILETQINALIDNAVDAKVQERADKVESSIRAEYQEELDLRNATIQSLRSELETGTAPYKAALDQVNQELAEVREQLRIAENNVEVWRRNAMGKPKVQEMFTAIRDQLPTEQRHVLEGLMKELPKGR